MVVTDANSGLGLTTAEALARSGATMFACGRDAARMNRAAATLRSPGSDGSREDRPQAPCGDLDRNVRRRRPTDAGTAFEAGELAHVHGSWTMASPDGRTSDGRWVEVFGLDRPVLAVLDDPRMLVVPGFGFHLGLIDGHTVGTAMSSCIDGVVRIAHVATLPSHRQRGLDEAINGRVPRHRRGCDLVLLQASPDGLPLYEQTGFRHATAMATWSLG